MAVVTRWFWVRHAPVINPDHIVYGASDMPVDVSETHMFAPAARALPRPADASRMTAMLELLYATGLRVSELVSLPVDQFRRDLASIVVTGKGGKERLVALGTPARAAIAAWIEDRDATDAFVTSQFLFPQGEVHMSRQQFASQLKMLAGCAGLDPRRVSPHVLRHSFATHLLSICSPC